MKKIIQANYKLERFELPREEAIKFMAEKDEDYKVELINDLPEDAGNFILSTGGILSISVQDRIWIPPDRSRR